MSFLPESDRYAFMQKRHVHIHDCDATCRLRLASALQYVESISTGHLEAMNLGHARLYGEGIVFVLAAQAIKVHRLPDIYNDVVIKTCPAAYQGAQMVRESVILSEALEPLIEVQASWVMIDPVRRKPLRASAFTYPLPALENWQPFYNPAKMKLTRATTPVMQRDVLYSQLDINRHMNNTVYADVVMDALPPEDSLGRTADTLLIRLRHETRAGERLDIFRDPCERGYLVSALVGDEVCFEAQVTFKD